MKKNTYHTALLTLFLALSTLLTSCSPSHQLNCKGEDGAMQQGFDNKNEEEVLAAINRGANVHARCAVHLFPPLHSAAGLGYLKVVTVLLKRGISVDSKDNNGYTPLNWAAMTGHHQVVQLLLQHGATVDGKANDGETPLHGATRYGHTQVVQLLLQHGATLSSKDILGNTPLHLAVRNGHTEVVQLLLQRGATLDSQNSLGYTPLYCAARNGHPQVVQLLLQRGATLDRRSNYGETPLMAVISSKSPRGNYTRGNAPLFKLLIDKPQNFYLTNRQGQTALEMAEMKFREVTDPAHKKLYSLVIAMLKSKMRP